MVVNVNCEDSSSHAATTKLVNQVLEIVEKNQRKTLKSIRKIVTETDPALAVIFESLIKRKALIVKEIKNHGKLDQFLSIANRNAIFYSISKLKDVLPTDDLKEKFLFWHQSEDKNENALLKKLKDMSAYTAFNTYLKEKFNNFSTVTDYCYSFFKRKEEKENRVPSPAIIPKKSNVSFNPCTASTLGRIMKPSEEKVNRKDTKKVENKKDQTKQPAKENTKKVEKQTTTKKVEKQVVKPVQQNKESKTTQENQSQKVSSRSRINDLNIRLIYSLCDVISQSQNIIKEVLGQNRDVNYDDLVKLTKSNFVKVDVVRDELKVISGLSQKLNLIKKDE